MRTTPFGSVVGAPAGLAFVLLNAVCAWRRRVTSHAVLTAERLAGRRAQRRGPAPTDCRADAECNAQR